METTLLEPAIRNTIIRALFDAESSSKIALRSLLSSVKAASRGLYDALNDEVIATILISGGKVFAALNDKFQQAKIKSFIVNNHWNKFEACKSKSNYSTKFRTFLTSHPAVVNLLATHNCVYTRALVKRYLLYTVKYGSQDFLASLLIFRIRNNVVQFPAKNILRSLEYSLKNNKNEFATILLPYLRPHFREVDPAHFAALETALRNKAVLNLENDVFHIIQRNMKSSVSLLQLLQPPSKKVIVPEGNPILITELPPKFTASVWHVFDRVYFKHSVSRTKVINWLVGTQFKDCYNISYYNNKGIRHEFEIPQTNRGYSYEGLNTTNIYELIVNTSLANEFLRNFAHQFVAVTEQALNLPLDEQPWFFGCISEEEAKSILYGAASNMFFLTLARGVTTYMCWSEPKRTDKTSLTYLTVKDAHALKIAVMRAVKHVGPILGFYNRGAPKNMAEYKLHQILAVNARTDTLHAVKTLVEETGLDVSTLRDPSPLWTYLTECFFPNTEVMKWLIDNKAYLFGDENPSILAKAIEKHGISYGEYLLSLGVKSDTSALIELLGKVPTREEFKTFWNCRKDNLQYSEILSKLLNMSEHYERRWNEVGTDLNSFGEKTKLILLAWKFGNSDNLFKMLPREILQLILQYDIDVPYWYSIGELILAGAPKRSVRVSVSAIGTILFIAKYSNSLAHFNDREALLQICRDEKYFRSHKTPKILRRLRRISPDLVVEKNSYPASTTSYPNVLPIIHHAINNTWTDLLEALLETKILDLKFFTESKYGIEVPPSWMACHGRKFRAIELLCKHGAIPLENGRNNKPLRLESWLAHQCIKEDMYELVLKCLNKYQHLSN